MPNRRKRAIQVGSIQLIPHLASFTPVRLVFGVVAGVEGMAGLLARDVDCCVCVVLCAVVTVNGGDTLCGA
jgi:hypothetical protein